MQLDEIKPVLLKNDWFAQLPDDVIQCIGEICRPKTLDKGQLLHAKNDPPEGLYCLIEGSIKISNVNQQGKEMVLTWLQPGNWFGEISLFDGLPRTHDSHAEIDSKLLIIPIQAFHELLQKRPDLYPHFMKLLCQRIRATFSLIDETGGLSLKGQLAKRLIVLANGLGQVPQQAITKEIAISQESLAHMLNSSRQTVNKLLHELKRNQVIDIKYGKIQLLDFETLMHIGEL